MTEKTEAMRLAAALRDGVPYDEAEIENELRRLHQFAEDQIGRATAAEAALQMTKATHALKIAAVEAQRDALLEALKQIEPILARMYGQQAAELPPMQIVRAAIKAVEEGK